MMSLRDEPAPPAPELASQHSAGDSKPARYRWRPWLTVAFVAGVLLVAGGAWWLLESTVPVSEYDDVVAQLDAAEEELASTQEALLTEQSRLHQVDQAALLLGYFAGVDRSIVDQRQYESWAGVVKLDMAVEAVDDPELTELYWEHMGEGGLSPGSEELVLRLVEVTIGPILQEP